MTDEDIDHWNPVLRGMLGLLLVPVTLVAGILVLMLWIWLLDSVLPAAWRPCVARRSVFPD
jgi:hypothetical protein